jgi:hypothetical protein
VCPNVKKNGQIRPLTAVQVADVTASDRTESTNIHASSAFIREIPDYNFVVSHPALPQNTQVSSFDVGG